MAQWNTLRIIHNKDLFIANPATVLPPFLSVPFALPFLPSLSLTMENIGTRDTPSKLTQNKMMTKIIWWRSTLSTRTSRSSPPRTETIAGLGRLCHTLWRQYKFVIVAYNFLLTQSQRNRTQFPLPVLFAIRRSSSRSCNWLRRKWREYLKAQKRRWTGNSREWMANSQQDRDLTW